jgi:hypothetical protein
MHLFHKYRNYEHATTVKWYEDNTYVYDRQVWIGKCDVCGKPKRKYVTI